MAECNPGLFVVFEGGEGAGKSVQAKALAKRLLGDGHAVTCVREPGGTLLGERLRSILLNSGDIGPLAETLLFFAARSQLIREVIRPALERGDIVIADRFTDSTRAYQGYGRGVPANVIDQLAAGISEGCQPDLKVLLDLPVGEGLARAAGHSSADRFESEDIAFHERVRAGYKQLAAADPDRWLVLDALLPVEAITDDVYDRVRILLSEQTRQ